MAKKNKDPTASFFAPIPFVGKIPKTDSSQLAQQQANPGQQFTGQAVQFVDNITLQRSPQYRFQELARDGTNSGNLSTKKTFVTSLFYVAQGIAGTGAGGDNLQLLDGSATGDVRIRSWIRDGNEAWSAVFPTALFFEGGVYLVNNFAGTGDFSLHITGWTED